ncbi:penicillin-binding protein 2 [endosymbiont of Pachyrhynchus infernalis]|nr:penicillin-binding protein 2 [endosymbiont of Pachyrhynchus infernalis]
MFIFNIILISNIYIIQIINFKNYNTKSYKNCTKLIPIYPIRGCIFDCNGIPIAINNIKYKIEIISGNIKDIDNLLFNLSKFIYLNKYEILDIKKNIKKNPPYIPITIKDNLDINNISKVLVNKFKFKNLIIRKYYIRYYPYRDLLSHLIGYVSKISKNDLDNIKNNSKFYNNYTIYDNIGKIGIEKYYEKLLRGKLGFLEVKVNNKGKIIKIKNKINSEHGKDIYLSIDIKLSKLIKKLLSNSKSSVIVTDPRNGNILSLISNPSFNLNKLVSKISIKNYKKIFSNKNFPMFNRATQGFYPPASTIKPYIALYALNSKLINENSLIFDPGWWKLPKSNKLYMDWKKEGRGWINIIKAIEESSDIFFYEIAYRIGINELSKCMFNFEYGKNVEIDILEKSKGLVPTKNWKLNKLKLPWYDGDTISVGIGQGYLSVTPLQMVNSLNILINNGIKKKLSIIESFYDYKKEFKIYLNKENNSNKSEYFNNISINTWNIVKKGMYGVVNNSNGTAFNYFKNLKYKIAAKTGTAQVFSFKNNYIKNNISTNLRNHKLMIAYAPFDNPKISIAIVLENEGFGGNNNIGYIVKKIFDYYLLN